MRKIEREEDWLAIYDEFLKKKTIAEPDTARLRRKIPVFLEKIKKVSMSVEKLIQADSQGYYELTIEQERSVPERFRCYKIKGKLALAEGDVSLDTNESHWIFFNTGVYDDLKPGQRVRVKPGKTERKHFLDIGYARNIYPDQLEVLEE